MTEETTFSGKNTCLSSAITEIDCRISKQSIRLGQLKALSQLTTDSSSGHGPLSINPKLRQVPPPSPLVLQGVSKRLQIYRRRMSTFRDAYRSKMNEMKEKEKAERKERQTSISTQEHLLREHRELTLVGDIHGISAASASKHSIERQLRMLRRGGMVQTPGNDASRVAHSLGKRRAAGKLAQFRADVSEYVPTGYGVRLDATSRRMEDPLKEYYDSKVINPWTMSERTLFLKLSIWIGKDFGKIAQHFTFKSTQDVVRFYYEHKLTFRLKEMRERYLEGEVITDDDIIMLSRTGTVAANMSWNFAREAEGDDERELHVGGSPRQVVEKPGDYAQGNETFQSKYKNMNNLNTRIVTEDEENVSFLSNPNGNDKFRTCTAPNADLVNCGSPCSINRLPCFVAGNMGDTEIQ